MPKNNLLEKWRRMRKKRVEDWRETLVRMYWKTLRETIVNTRLRDLESNSGGMVKNGNNLNTLALNSFAAKWEGPHKTAVWSDSFNHSFSAPYYEYKQGSVLRLTVFRAASPKRKHDKQVRMLYKSDKRSGSNGQTGDLEAVYWGRLKSER
jgi:hypothetical protein